MVNYLFTFTLIYIHLFIHSRLSLASWPLLPQSLSTGTTSRRGPPPTAQASPGPAMDAGESVTLMLSQDMAPPLESTQDTVGYLTNYHYMTFLKNSYDR